MEVNRMAYVVFYQGKKIVNKLETLEGVEIAYVSKKQHYAIFYSDANQEKRFKKILKDVKGFKFVGQSHGYDETLNFTC